jgi:HSP20 family protein
MSTKALSRPYLSPSLFDEFFKPWNEMFGPSYPSRMLTMPAVNVKEDKDGYMVSLAAPGLKKEDFTIDIEGNMLTISAEKEEEKEETEDMYSRKEYNFTSFSRSFTLPEDIKQEFIDASYQDGVLNIKLPRSEEAKKAMATKKISVK